MSFFSRRSSRPRNLLPLFFVVIVFSYLFFFFFSSYSPLYYYTDTAKDSGSSTTTSTTTITTNMSSSPVQHIVLFQFKADVEEQAVKDACARMLALKDNCLHPSSQTPYIKSFSGGKDHSPEGAQAGMQYAFIVEFASLEDRDYYVKSDPAHQAFIKSVGGVVEKAIVVDYTPGQFES